MFSFRTKPFLTTLLVLSMIYVLAFSATGITAQEDGPICSNKNDCQDKIDEYEEKLEDAREEKDSLQSQISIMNTKVELARARIETTKHQIEDTQTEIGELSGKIEKLNTSLDHLTRILLQKIVEGYKNRQAGYLDIFLSSEASTLANQLKYIRLAQENDRLLALRTQQVKVNFSEQKNLREVKKTELEQLEAQLEAQRLELNAQITQKEALLAQTQSDERRYQQLLSQALSEFQAVSKALETGKKVGDVKKGDPIALVGNTGYPYCSTGAHLHYEVRKGDHWIDPNPYMGGDWSKPLSDPITITQGYGITPWSWRYQYSNGIHTGLDMVSKSSDVIRAVGDGTLYTSSQNCSGAIIKIVYIEHGNDITSLYLHVQ